MRSLIVSCNVTVDGYMAGPADDLASLGFIVADPEQENALAARLKDEVGAILLGRRTFFDMEAYWTKVDSPMADWLNTAPKIVVSTNRDLDVSIWNNSTLAVGDAVDQAERLKATEGSAIEGSAIVVFGGVRTIRSLVAADLVDEYWLKVSPVAIGEGSSMFESISDPRRLTLREVRRYPSGLVDITYVR